MSSNRTCSNELEEYHFRSRRDPSGFTSWHRILGGLGTEADRSPRADRELASTYRAADPQNLKDRHRRDLSRCSGGPGIGVSDLLRFRGLEKDRPAIRSARDVNL